MLRTSVRQHSIFRFLSAAVQGAKPLPVKALRNISGQSSKRTALPTKVEVITVGCFGFCEKGPIVKIIPDNTFYTQVTPEDAEDIINEHIIGGRKIERLLYIDPKTEQTVSDSKHMDFYRKQLRIALRNCGFIDP